MNMSLFPVSIILIISCDPFLSSLCSPRYLHLYFGQVVYISICSFVLVDLEPHLLSFLLEPYEKLPHFYSTISYQIYFLQMPSVGLVLLDGIVRSALLILYFHYVFQSYVEELCTCISLLESIVHSQYLRVILSNHHLVSCIGCSCAGHNQRLTLPN